MPKLPVVSAKQLIKILENLGFVETRQKGSHKFFSHPYGRVTSVPFHTGEGLLRKILNQVEISPEDFRKLLKK